MPAVKIDKDELLMLCWETFHQKGYHGTSLSDLALATGLGKSGLLHHFGSKEGIMDAVMEFALRSFRTYVLAVAQEDLPVEQRLEKLLRRQNCLSKKERQGCFFANVILEIGREERYRDEIGGILDEWIATIALLLAHRYPQSQAKELSYRLLLEYEGSVMLYKLYNDTSHLERYVQRAVAHLTSPDNSLL